MRYLFISKSGAILHGYPQAFREHLHGNMVPHPGKT